MEPSPLCLRVGAQLVVNLTMSSSAGGSYWQTPSSSDETVLKRVSGGPTTGGGATATFDALSIGQAVVSAATGAACFHSQPPCAMPSFLWRLQVSVAR
jgi:hypothetical protein